MIRFVQRHHTIAALLYRLGLQGWVSRRVWAELDTPAFRERMGR